MNFHYLIILLLNVPQRYTYIEIYCVTKYVCMSFQSFYEIDSLQILFFLLPQIRSNTFCKYPKADCLTFEIKCLIFGNDGQENYCVSFLFKLSNQRKRLRVYATKLSSSAS